MSIIFLISISLLLVTTLLLLFVSRSTLVLMMLLPASQMLGFLDPSVMAIRGGFDIHALLAIIITIAIASSITRFRDLRKARLFKPMLVLVLFWLYGVCAPILRDHSQVLLAIEASKEFMMIFSYFAVFLFLRTEKEINWGWNILLILGSYYCLVEVFAQIFGPSLMRHTTYSFRPDAFGLWKIYVPFWPLILLTLFYYYYSFALGLSRPFIRIVLGCIGLLLTFFRSYLLATIVAIPVILFLSKQNVSRSVIKSAILVGLISVAGLGITLLLAPEESTLGKISETFVFSGAREIVGKEVSGSLEGRELFAQQLRTISTQRPYFGFGFINRESEIVPTLNLRGFAGSVLGFVDKGNIDILTKFGYLGGTAIYGTFLYILLIYLRDVRKKIPSQLSVRLLTACTILLVFFIVQPVHSAFTYSFSLLPLGIVLGLIDRELRITATKKPNT